MTEKTKEKKEKEAKNPYVSCVEVRQYLTELSKVLSQISDGILESIETMNERVDKEKGDQTNDE